MTKSEYQTYLGSEHWLNFRKRILTDRNRCERCYLPRWLAELLYDQDLHLHHRNYASRGHETDEDVEVLCRRCHEIETFNRSDLPAPRKVTCAACGCQHYDPHNSLCHTCETVFGTDYIFCSGSQFEVIWKMLLSLIAGRSINNGADRKQFLSWAETAFDRMSLTAHTLYEPRSLYGGICDSDIPF